MPELNESQESNARTGRFGQRSNDEAVAAISDRMAVRRSILDKMVPEVRARAFAVAGVEDLNRVKKINEALAKIPAGGDWREAKGIIAGELGGGTGAQHRAENIVKTNVFQAYSSARYRKQLADKDIMPYLVYHAVGDGKTRASHQALDGVILPVDDPFWRDHYPPWDYGSRCTVSGMTAEEAERFRGKKGAEEGLRLLNKKELNRIAPPPALNGYSFDPATMALSIDDINERYGNADGVGAIQAVARKMRSKEISGLAPDGVRTENVWNWMLREQIKKDADVLREKSFGRGAVEGVVVRDALTGRKLAEKTGTEKSVDVTGGDYARGGLKRDKIAIHSHVKGDSVLPSKEDVMVGIDDETMGRQFIVSIDQSCTFEVPELTGQTRGEFLRSMEEAYAPLENANAKSEIERARRIWEDWLRAHVEYISGYEDKGIEL